MLTFLLSTLAGATIGSSYVLLRTPRSGRENQAFILDFIETTKINAEHVSEQAFELEQSLNNLTMEVQNIQQYFVPDLLDIVDDFKMEADSSKRRIQDEIQEINRELEQFKS